MINGNAQCIYVDILIASPGGSFETMLAVSFHWLVFVRYNMH